MLAYREAYRLLPGDPLTANNLGYILADHGTTPDDFAEAVRLTRGVVEKMPDQPVFLDSFGWALFKRGDSAQNDLAGARRRLREAVDLAPDMPELHLHLAAVYEALNKLPDALREAEIAAQLASAPDDIAARTLRDRLKPLVAPPSPSASPIETQQARPQEP